MSRVGDTQSLLAMMPITPARADSRTAARASGGFVVAAASPVSLQLASEAVAAEARDSPHSVHPYSPMHSSPEPHVSRRTSALTPQRPLAELSPPKQQRSITIVRKSSETPLANITPTHMAMQAAKASAHAAAATGTTSPLSVRSSPPLRPLIISDDTASLRAAQQPALFALSSITSPPNSAIPPARLGESSPQHTRTDSSPLSPHLHVVPFPPLSTTPSPPPRSPSLLPPVPSAIAAVSSPSSSSSASSSASVALSAAPVQPAARPGVRLTLPIERQGSASGVANRYNFPVFGPDGDVDRRYVNQMHVRRKRQVGHWFALYAIGFVLLEVAYIVRPDWTITERAGWVPVFLRLVHAMIVLAFVWANRQLYVARFITQTPERFDLLALATLLTGVACLIGMETSRGVTGEVIQHGILLALGLVYGFAFGIVQLRWTLLGILGAAGMSIYILALRLADTQSPRQLMLGVGFQLVLIIVLCGLSWRTELLRADTLNSQRLQYLERKKAEKLLRSMLPMRILTDYLDGSIGQVQANATIGFVQMHLGAIPSAGPPGSHPNTSPAAIASPGELMQKLHDTFKRIDGIVSMYAIRGVSKIETVSTTYLLCAGLLQEIDDHAAAMIDVSLEIMSMVTTRLNIGGTAKRIPVLLRIGISSGPVVGGIIGAQRRFFRVFGDTVNVAARMCTNVSMGCIQISPSCHASLSERQRLAYRIPAGSMLDIKGKGLMMCYRIESRADWVPKFNKSNMNRGQQDRDEPLLNKSFVYHKLVARTELSWLSLRFRQERQADGSEAHAQLEKQATFVRHPPTAVPHVRTPSQVTSILGERQGSKLALPQSPHSPGGSNPRSPMSLGGSMRRHGPHGSEGGLESVGNADRDLPVRRAQTAMVLSAPVVPPAVPHTVHTALTSSPFSSASIERYFQLSYARLHLPEVRLANLVFALFFAGMIVYIVRKHTGGWATTQELHPTILLGVAVGLFVLFDVFSVAQQAWRHLVGRCAPDDADCPPEANASNVGTDTRSLATNQTPSGSSGFNQSGGFGEAGRIGTPSLAAAQSKSSKILSSPAAPAPDDTSGPTHFAVHFQLYSGVLATLLHLWVLVDLALGGTRGDMELQPAMAGVLVTFYSAFILRLQFRWLAPLAVCTWVVFFAVMVSQNTSAAQVLLLVSHLALAVCMGLGVLYASERMSRSNFLLAYALEKEQEYMDQFLNNLLPKDVVLLLKKQNPALAKEVVRAGGRTAPGRGLGAQRNGAVATAQNHGRAVGGSSLGEGGGLASRFAMHFPATTVFESDIVGYTKMVSSLSPSDTLNLLNLIFSRFDQVAHDSGVEKIETIGDAFMCMTFDGPPDPVLDFALQIVDVLEACNRETQPKQNLQIRMGICTGSCFGGIVGTEIPRFHLFGQAHDVAIHIEQNGRQGDIIVSHSTYALSADRYEYEPLDLIVDEFKTFQLQGKREYDDAGEMLLHADEHVVSIAPQAALPSAITAAPRPLNRAGSMPTMSGSNFIKPAAAPPLLAMASAKHSQDAVVAVAAPSQHLSTRSSASTELLPPSFTGSVHSTVNSHRNSHRHSDNLSNSSAPLSASINAVSSTPTIAPVISDSQFVNPVGGD